MKFTSPAIALLAACTLPGCAYFSQPAARPIIEEHAQNQINAFAIQPSRRMMLVKNNMNRSGEHGTAAMHDGLLRDKAILICAEASPDVSDDILASLAAAAAGKMPATGSSPPAELSASFAQALSVTGQSLFKRSQAVQLYRDAAYHLCQAKMNGYLNDSQFVERIDAAHDTTAQLLMAEIPWLYAQSVAAPKERLTPDAMPSVEITKDGKVTISFAGKSTTVEPPASNPAAKQSTAKTGQSQDAAATDRQQP